MKIIEFVKKPNAFVGRFIDLFQDFMNDRRIVIPNPERDNNPKLKDDESFNIYGSDRAFMRGYFEEMFSNWDAPIDRNDLAEFEGQAIDMFEDFLDDRKIVLDNSEREEDPNMDPEDAANIFGSDYGELQTGIEEILEEYKLI